MKGWVTNRLEVYGNEADIARWTKKKWEFGQETETLNSPEMVTLQFKTSYDPPYKFITQMAGDFPELRFDLYYYEPVSKFAGALEFANGQIRRDEFYENNEEALQEFVMEQFNTDLNLIDLQ